MFTHALSLTSEDSHERLCLALEQHLGINHTVEPLDLKKGAADEEVAADEQVAKRISTVAQAILNSKKETFTDLSLSLAAELEKFLNEATSKEATPLEIVYLKFRLGVSSEMISDVEDMMATRVRGYAISPEDPDPHQDSENRIGKICKFLLMENGRVNYVLYEQVRYILDKEGDTLKSGVQRQMFRKESSVRLSMTEAILTALQGFTSAFDLSVHLKAILTALLDATSALDLSLNREAIIASLKDKATKSFPDLSLDRKAILVALLNSTSFLDLSVHMKAILEALLDPDSPPDLIVHIEAILTALQDYTGALDLSVHTDQEHTELLHMLIALAINLVDTESRNASCPLAILAFFAGYYRSYLKKKKPKIEIGSLYFIIPRTKCDAVKQILYRAGFVSDRHIIELGKGEKVDLSKVSSHCALYLALPDQPVEIRPSKSILQYHKEQDQALATVGSHSVSLVGPADYWQFYPEILGRVRFVDFRLPIDSPGMLSPPEMPNCRELTLTICRHKREEGKQPPIISAAQIAEVAKQAPNMKSLFISGCALDAIEMQEIAEVVRSAPYLTHLSFQVTFFNGDIETVKRALGDLASALEKRQASLDLTIYTQPFVEEIPEEPNLGLEEGMGDRTIRVRRKSHAKELHKVERAIDHQDQRFEERKTLSRHGTLALLNALKHAGLSDFRVHFDVWSSQNFEPLVDIGGSITLSFNNKDPQESSSSGALESLDQEIMHRVGRLTLKLPERLTREKSVSAWYPDIIKALFACSFTYNVKNELKILDLSHINLSEEGLRALVEALKNIEDLHHINLAGNQLTTKEAVEALRDLITADPDRGTDLLSLNLEGNLFSQGTCKVKPQAPRRRSGSAPQLPDVSEASSSADPTYEVSSSASAEGGMHLYEPPPYESETYGSGLYVYSGSSATPHYLDLDLYFQEGVEASLLDEGQFGFGNLLKLEEGSVGAPAAASSVDPSSGENLYDVDVETVLKAAAASGSLASAAEDMQPQVLHGSAGDTEIDEADANRGSSENPYDVDVEAVLKAAAASGSSASATVGKQPQAPFGYRGDVELYEVDADRGSITEQAHYTVEKNPGGHISEVELAHRQTQLGEKLPPTLPSDHRITHARETTVAEEVEPLPESCALDGLFDAIGSNCKRLRGLYLAGCGWSEQSYDHLTKMLGRLENLCDLSFGTATMPTSEVKKVVQFALKTNIQSLHCPHPDVKTQQMLAAFNASRLNVYFKEESEA